MFSHVDDVSPCEAHISPIIASAPHSVTEVIPEGSSAVSVGDVRGAAQPAGRFLPGHERHGVASDGAARHPGPASLGDPRGRVGGQAAAVAERHGVRVLHYDRDFDLIAEVTGQPVEWVVPYGTADEAGPG